MNQPARDQKEPGKGEPILQSVSEAENILGQDKIEASRTKLRVKKKKFGDIFITQMGIENDLSLVVQVCNPCKLGAYIICPRVNQDEQKI